MLAFILALSKTTKHVFALGFVRKKFNFSNISSWNMALTIEITHFSINSNTKAVNIGLHYTASTAPRPAWSGFSPHRTVLEASDMHGERAQLHQWLLQQILPKNNPTTSFNYIHTNTLLIPLFDKNIMSFTVKQCLKFSSSSGLNCLIFCGNKEWNDNFSATYWSHCSRPHNKPGPSVKHSNYQFLHIIMGCSISTFHTSRNSPRASSTIHTQYWTYIYLVLNSKSSINREIMMGHL